MSEQQKFYTPSEAAKLLNVSVATLRYMRLTGRIEGTDLGNTTVYTEEQIKKADFTHRKPGPKSKDESSPCDAHGKLAVA